LNPKKNLQGIPNFHPLKNHQQKSHEKSPSPCESKSPMCWWSPQHLNSTRLCEWPVSMKVPGWWCIASSWHSLTKTETRLFHMGIGWIGW
jgi:hypothetical protein